MFHGLWSGEGLRWRARCYFVFTELSGWRRLNSSKRKASKKPKTTYTHTHQKKKKKVWLQKVRVKQTVRGWNLLATVGWVLSGRVHVVTTTGGQRHVQSVTRSEMMNIILCLSVCLSLCLSLSLFLSAPISVCLSLSVSVSVSLSHVYLLVSSLARTSC